MIYNIKIPLRFLDVDMKIVFANASDALHIWTVS